MRCSEARPIFSSALPRATSPRSPHIGSPAMAFLVGAGAAVAIGGAVIGTLAPQVFATINSFDIRASADLILAFNGAVILIGVVTTLAYFHFGGGRARQGAQALLVPRVGGAAGG